MNKNENLTRRNRLTGFNYANPGYYLATACAMNRIHLFSRVREGQVLLQPIGSLIDEVLTDTMVSFGTMTLQDYVIMPNHVHLLVYVSLENEDHTVSELMKKLKGVSAARVRREALLPPGLRSVWQKGFHDQVIRNDAHLDQVRKYIADNPRKWEEDEYF